MIRVLAQEQLQNYCQNGSKVIQLLKQQLNHVLNGTVFNILKCPEY